VPVEEPPQHQSQAFGRTSFPSRCKNLQAAYWRNWLGTFMAQAEELRALSTKVTADTAEPIKAHVTRGMNELHKNELISSL
jgi:hypothetical protein